MEQTIRINCPEGKKAIYNESTQTIDFVDIVSRSKSWNEFCNNHPYIDEEYYISDCGSVRPIVLSYRKCSNNLATKEDAEGILALIQLTRLHDEWVGDWKYTPHTGYYSIFIVANNIGVYHCENTYKILGFPNKEMAQEFLDCFKDLIEKARKFI